jgi:diguanylate cyclase (GGDEF)-like protein
MTLLERHSAGSMAVSTTRLLTAGLVALALLPPLLTLAAGVVTERHDAQAAAQSIAWACEQLGSTADRARLTALLDTGKRGDARWSELVGRDGAVLASGGDVQARDGLAITASIELRGPGPVAAVRVGEALHEALALAALVALLSCGTALWVWNRVVKRSMGALRKAEGRLRSISVVDPLTGLFNRAGLHQRLQRALAAARQPNRCSAVLLIDLDRFRLINESLGQAAGDQLLRAVAERVRGVLRPGDSAARLGGDQFVVHTEALAGEQAAAVMARNLLRAIEPALTIALPAGQREALVTVSIGIAFADDGVDGPDPLLAHADAAMRAAKAGGGGRFRVFEPSMLVDHQQRLELDVALRRALHAGEFALAFQPIVDTAVGRITAVEALLRWNDPQRGLVSPGEFIPVLEQTGLIVPVGQWVLREACRRMQSWVAQGAAPVTLSVNVSPMQFAETDFVQDVLAALDFTGFPAWLLQLEVTEGLLLDPTPESLHKMDALVDAGVRLAVDDFGVGYSSLAYLKRFRLHALKIDRMFVRDVPADRRGSAIVRAIVELAHALELQVTAEGVETEDQREALHAMGCDSLQGFLLARPQPPEAMREMLIASGGAVAAEGPSSDWSTTMASLLDTPIVR